MPKEETSVTSLALYKDFIDHFKDENQFLNWCSDFYNQFIQNSDRVECLHTKLDTNIRCISYGSWDKAKKCYMIRKSTLFSHIMIWLKKQSDDRPDTSTKCSVYHISFFAKYHNEPDKWKEVKQIKGVIRHLCGCSCCSKSHLKIGTKSENGKDFAFHYVRDTNCKNIERYNTFVSFCVNKHDEELII